MAQLVSLIDTSAVDHFAAALGHHMEQIEDDLGVWAVCPNPIHTGRHVDCDGTELLGNTRLKKAAAA